MHALEATAQMMSHLANKVETVTTILQTSNSLLLH